MFFAIFLFLSSFLFVFLQHKRQKQKGTSLSESLIFGIPTTFGTKKLFWHPYTPSAILKVPTKHDKLGGKTNKTILGPDIDATLDQLLTQKPPNLGPDSNSTAYMHPVGSVPGPQFHPFVVNSLDPVLFGSVTMGRFERFRFWFRRFLSARFFCFNTVSVSVPEKQFRRFRILFRFLEVRFQVPVQFLGHPELWGSEKNHARAKKCVILDSNDQVFMLCPCQNLGCRAGQFPVRRSLGFGGGLFLLL